MRRLLEQCPQESDTLESFPEAHLIRHDTSILVFDEHTSGAFIQKLGRMSET
jgi:hypothetical protein